MERKLFGSVREAWRSQSLLSRLFTLAAAAAAVFALWKLFLWGVEGAVFAPDYEACRQASGACWGFVAEKWRIILFGRFPYEEQWRPPAVLDTDRCEGSRRRVGRRACRFLRPHVRRRLRSRAR